MDLQLHTVTSAELNTVTQINSPVTSATPIERPKVKFMAKNPKLVKFPNTANVIKQARVAMGVVSQEALSRNIGYNNGQFISNMERGLCALPDDKIKVTSEFLGIDPEILIDAILADYKLQMTEKLK